MSASVVLSTLPAVTSYSHYGAALAVILKRIEFQRQNGLLVGLTFSLKPREVDAVGDGQMPYLRMSGMRLEETHAQGAPAPGTKRNNTPQTPYHVYQFNLMTNYSAGMVQLHPENERLQARGHLDWIALIFDAIELDEFGKVDCLLEGTCPQPLTFLTDDTDLDGGAIESRLSVRVYLNDLCRGSRRTPMFSTA